MIRLEIPMKLPSLNEYVNTCRYNKYAGNQMKQDIQNEIALYTNTLPKFEKPIKIHFYWCEGNSRRDLDNICFGKKFILDTLVKTGKLKDDNRKYVYNFEDSFMYTKNVWKIILEIEEQ